MPAASAAFPLPKWKMKQSALTAIKTTIYIKDNAMNNALMVNSMMEKQGLVSPVMVPALLALDLIITNASRVPIIHSCTIIVALVIAQKVPLTIQMDNAQIALRHAIPVMDKTKVNA